MFSPEVLSEIRQKIPILELVSDSVQLKKTGKSHRGLCPFHQERTPSFYVSPERESFHCFGCGVGGDLFDFVMKLEGLEFPQAVEQLGERAGLNLEKSKPINPEIKKRRQQELEINRQAAWYYHCLLKQAPKQDTVWFYLKERQVSDISIQEFFLGYCPPKPSGLRDHLKQKGFKDSDIETSGLFRAQKEFFRGRLIFPIFRSDGKVVGFGGRRISEKDFGPKYLNSAESPLFKKGELFYGLTQAKTQIRNQDQVLLTEGYLDVITLHAQGFKNAVGPLGTALTQHQARSLKRLAGEITLVFDGDRAGKNAMLRALEIFLAHGIQPTALYLDPGEDPDSFLKHKGRLSFENKLRARRNLLEYLIEQGTHSVVDDSGNIAAKAKVAHELLRYIEKIPDTLVKNLYRRRLAQGLEVPENWLGQLGKSQKITATPLSSADKKINCLPEEEIILEVWLKFPGLRAVILEKVSPEDFLSPSLRQLAVKFWEFTRQNPEAQDGHYFDLAGPEWHGMLSRLSLKPGSLEDADTAWLGLKQALLRIRERKLKLDLKSLRSQTDQKEIYRIQEKINELSQVLKDKEVIHDSKEGYR